MPDRCIDPYFSGLLNAFENEGVDVHLILANDLVGNLQAHCLKNEISESKLISYINTLNPDFIFNSNRAGITKGILENTTCPIITWMVDLMPFLHHGGDHKDLFCERDHLITSSFKSVEVFETIYPVLKNRVHYIPVATNISDFNSIKFNKKDINISFIGSLFDFQYFNKIIDYCKETPWAFRNLMTLTECIRKDYYLDVEKKVSDLNLDFVLKYFSIDAHFLKAIISNTISNNDRIKILGSITDLGLHLYGTVNWTTIGQYSLKLLSSFQFDKPIDNRKKLVEVYQRSKISINISHNQAVDGLPYRIFDIMASDSLLITNYRKNSDIFLLFGKDFPIPMYRNKEELREKVKYFLENEDERVQIVKKCQQAVSEGYTFNDRVKIFFEIIRKPLHGSKSEIGKVTILDKSLFRKKLHQKLNLLNKSHYEDKLLILHSNPFGSLTIILQLFSRKIVNLIVRSSTQNQRVIIKNRIKSLTTPNFRRKVDYVLELFGIMRANK